MKIGFIDSGLGGAKVLDTAFKLGLTGDIYFLADLKNNPYGEKESDYIKKITIENVSYLINLGCEIIVIACNTATAVAIDDVRKKFPDTKIFGIEPAIKAIVNSHKKGLVLGTKVTLNEKKFNILAEKLNIKDKLELVCANELVKLIESNTSKEDIDNYLKKIFKPYNLNNFSHIILGCTHYPIIKSNIENIVKKYNNEIEIVDGSIGLIKNVLKSCTKLDYINLTLVLTEYKVNFINKFKSIVKYDFKITYK